MRSPCGKIQSLGDGSCHHRDSSLLPASPEIHAIPLASLREILPPRDSRGDAERAPLGLWMQIDANSTTLIHMDANSIALAPQLSLSPCSGAGFRGRSCPIPQERHESRHPPEGFSIESIGRKSNHIGTNFIPITITPLPPPSPSPKGRRLQKPHVRIVNFFGVTQA